MVRGHGRECRRRLAGAFALLVLLLGGVPVFSLDVTCVSWLGDPENSHPMWSGKEVTLKGTVRHEGVVDYAWDFGDGSPVVSGQATATGEYPFPLEARHAYEGPDGRLFVARLTVAAGVESAFAEYRVVVLAQEATLDVEIDVAIDEGLWWLYKTGQRWSNGGVDYARWGPTYVVAHTGFAVQVFQSNGHRLLGEPREDPYVDLVGRGLNYLLSRMGKVAFNKANGDVGGNEDGSPNGYGLVCSQSPSHEMYETGVAMVALSSSGAPGRVAEVPNDGVQGRTYRNILQDLADFCAFAQNEGCKGWRYVRNDGSGCDNSATQWSIIGLHTGETQEEWGVTVADFVRPNLKSWLTASQNANGGFGYEDDTNWLNIAKTAGSGITGLAFVCGADPSVGDCPGLAVDSTTFRRALDYVAAHWRDATDSNNHSMNFGNIYAMFTVKKAFAGEFLDRDAYRRIPGTDHDWHAEYARYLLDRQRPAGNWTAAEFERGTSDELTTSLALLILVPGLTERPPVAIAKANGTDETHVDKGDTVVLDGSASIRGRYPIASYVWDFGDGTKGGGETVEHTYENYIDELDPGKNRFTDPYVVTLTVTDSRDLVTGKPPLTDTDTCFVFVHEAPHAPVAQFEFRPPFPCAGETVTLDGSGSYDPNPRTAIVEWLWDLDSDEIYGEPGEIGQVIEVTLPTAGTYPVSLKVVSENENVERETSAPVFQNITVSEDPPPVAIVTSPEVDDPAECPEEPIDSVIEISSNVEIQLSGSCSRDVACKAPREIAAYAWDLDGDGNFGEEDDPPEPTAPTVLFVSSEVGFFTVCLRVRDGAGRTDTVCRSFSVGASPTFVRGDCNADGAINIADAVELLEHLFLGEQHLTCVAACDVNAADDPILCITDPIYLLRHLFLGGPPPVPPFPRCGTDPHDGDCVSFPSHACPE